MCSSSGASNDVSAVGSGSPGKAEKSEKPVNFVPRRRASVSAETSSVTMGKIVQKVVHEKSDDAKERIKIAMEKCILFDGTSYSARDPPMPTDVRARTSSPLLSVWALA